MSTTPRRIYVACLAAYNSGILHGAWIDTEGKDADELSEEVNAMLAASPIAGAEEFAIHDHEGFGGLLGEYSSLSEVAELDELLEEHGDAFLAFLKAFGVSRGQWDKFSEAYYGEAESEKQFAEDYAVEAGTISADHPMFSYIDWEHYWNGELRHSFTIEDGYVFRSGW